MVKCENALTFVLILSTVNFFGQGWRVMVLCKLHLYSVVPALEWVLPCHEWNSALDLNEPSFRVGSGIGSISAFSEAEMFAFSLLLNTE